MNNLSLILWRNFLGDSPHWLKTTVVIFLLVNPIIFFIAGPYITSCLVVAEFIFVLSTAHKCYPLQPGGLIALEAILLNLTNPSLVRDEVFDHFSIILLLMFLVAGIFFMKELLFYIFTKLLLTIRPKPILSLLFLLTSAILAAFFDALTIIAVLIGTTTGFLKMYEELISSKKVPESELQDFHAFLRGLLMHSAIGSALGGVCTIIGEPQNLLISEKTGWDFLTFFQNMSPVTMPVFASGVLLCFFLEKVRYLDYGAPLPENTLATLRQLHDKEMHKTNDYGTSARLIVQCVAALTFAYALANHVAEIGLIGLGILILQTAFNGVTDEHKMGEAFEESLPFAALLVTFFVISSIINNQELFTPVMELILTLDNSMQPQALFIATGFLSIITDNVFVATIYINEITNALYSEWISRTHFEKLAIAINAGTNIPSVATPNGQAALLFLLTSSIAPKISLSYGKMVLLALPYAVILATVAYLAIGQL